ncbi:hypothetical protein EDB85DRAFT_1920237 [Lactarius pseudohatsudake]|nr:hypothetical protein EDB85DRAFT_1920237 [Lactarius pseudohatsudake]
MSPPTAPITSTSSARSKKQKKPTEKRAKKPAKVAAAASSSDAEDRMMVAPESVDPTPAYVPPAGSVPADLDIDVDFGEFDYDAVKADEEGAELWLVRAPTAVKAKNLQGIQVLSSDSVSGRVGELSRKSTAYDIWSLSPPSSSSHQPHVGAEELNGLSVLLPRKRKGGKLFLAPKPVVRHLVVAARPAEPMRRDAASDPATFQNPPREAYPDEALTHRFRPYGDPGDPPPPPPEDQMDLGVDDRHAEEGGAGGKGKERRKKRRGGEAVESPKKAKKAKTAAS